MGKEDLIVIFNSLINLCLIVMLLKMDEYTKSKVNLLHKISQEKALKNLKHPCRISLID